MWFFHDKTLSIVKPRNLILLILVFIDVETIIHGDGYLYFFKYSLDVFK